MDRLRSGLFFLILENINTAQLVSWRLPVTCRTLFALISAAMGWLLLPQSRLFCQESSPGDIILAQAKQGDSEAPGPPPTDGEDSAPESGDAPVVQMQAKKSPPKKPVKSKKVIKPAKPSKAKKPAPVVRAAPAKSTPFAPAVAPIPTPAPRVVQPPPPRPTTAPIPTPNSRFQVPIPEEKGDLNIWGDDPFAVPVARPIAHQFGLLGIVNYLGAGIGAEYIHRQLTWMDWGAQVTKTQAKLTESKNPETDEFLRSDLTHVKALARFFSNRRLYATAGLSFSQVTGSYGWEGAGVEDGSISSDFKAQLIQLEISIGSEWEIWKGVYLGVDWLGVGLPLSTSINYQSNSDLDDITKFLTGSTTDKRIQTELDAQFRPYYGIIRIGYSL